ncbi:MAG: hypothetical protein ACFFCE_11580 [Promethearchaeota archaeon]
MLFFTIPKKQEKRNEINLNIISKIIIISNLEIIRAQYKNNPKMIKKISSDIIRSIERINKQINKIPSLNHDKIIERILESFIEIFKKKRKND